MRSFEEWRGALQSYPIGDVEWKFVAPGELESLWADAREQGRRDAMKKCDDMLDDYYETGKRAGLEEAAKLCDAKAAALNAQKWESFGAVANNLAELIRKLPEKEKR